MNHFHHVHHAVRSIASRPALLAVACGALLLACGNSKNASSNDGAGGAQAGASGGSTGGSGGEGGTTQLTGGSGGAGGVAGATGGGAGSTGGNAGASTGGSAGTGGSGGTTTDAAAGGAGGTTAPLDGGKDAPAGNSGYDPAKFYWSISMADTLIKKYPDGVPDVWFSNNPWSWETGYLMWGMEKVWRATKQQKYFDYIKAFVDKRIDATGKITAFDPGALDHFLLGYTVTMLYEETKDQKYKAGADNHRNPLKPTWTPVYPRTADGGFGHNNGEFAKQMWVDGAFMGEMFMARYGKTFADTTAFDEVQKQMNLMVTHLAKPSGLLLHAWAENKTAYWNPDPVTGLSSDVWNEGLGWYAVLIADVFDFLPADHTAVPGLKTIRDKLVAGLATAVDPTTGMWCQVVDKCTQAGNWPESSGTGMFIYLIQKSINRGFISAGTYQPIVDKAYAGLLTKATNANGTISVKDISSIGVASSYQAYISSPKDVDKPSGMTSFMVSSLIRELPGTQ
jgi:rhamnogalacturonyl hydrolase YesR